MAASRPAVVSGKAILTRTSVSVASGMKRASGLSLLCISLSRTPSAGQVMLPDSNISGRSCALVSYGSKRLPGCQGRDGPDLRPVGSQFALFRFSCAFCLMKVVYTCTIYGATQPDKIIPAANGAGCALRRKRARCHAVSSAHESLTAYNRLSPRIYDEPAPQHQARADPVARRRLAGSPIAEFVGNDVDLSPCRACLFGHGRPVNRIIRSVASQRPTPCRTYSAQR